ncbi:MAG: ComEC/Rec2 family competence protein [Clostridia bacterium]|nr:ComEC/Rec2 family competence protein [Clostridia bacterium]
MQNHYEGSTLISGRVMVAKNFDYNCSVVLDNVLIDGKSSGENILVTVFNATEIQIGDTMSLIGKLKDVSLFTLKNFNSYYYHNGIKHITSVDFTNISIIKSNNLTWAENVRLSVKELLINNMSETEASVCYASLFGDKSDIPNNVKTNFSISSQAHLLAVSGLHIGFLVAFISKLLSKTKIKKYAKVMVLIVILGFYCYLCSFASSVVRASIMFLILSFGGIIGRKYDRLNAWSVAGLCILLIRPMYVYDLGFLLSFACVFCIIVFMNPAKRLLLKMHVPEFLAFPLSVSISVQIGLLPILSMGYSKISLLGIIASVITVPFFEIIFIMLFVFSTICLILPFLTLLLKIPMMLMGGLIWLVEQIASFKWAIIELTRLTGILVISIYVAFFICSNLINIGKTIKLYSIAVLLLVAVIITSFMTKAIDVNGKRFAIFSAYGKSAYYVEVGSSSYFVGDFNNALINAGRSFLKSTNIYNVDYYISFSKNSPNDDECFGNIYNLENIENFGLEQNSNVEIVKLNNKLAGIVLQNENKKIFFCTNQKFFDGLCQDFALEHYDIDLIVGDAKYVMQYASYLDCIVIKDGEEIINKTTSTKLSGNYMFDFEDNKVLNLRSVD